MRNFIKSVFNIVVNSFAILFFRIDEGLIKVKKSAARIFLFIFVCVCVAFLVVRFFDILAFIVGLGLVIVVLALVGFN